MANNDKVVVKNGKQGFLSKIGNSIASIPAGIIILIMGILILAGNEKTNVQNIKDVKELRGQVVDISSEKVESKDEGRLVAIHGKLDYNEAVLKDEIFNVNVKAPAFERNVEVYQWVEDSETKDDETTYTYSKEWKSEFVNSDDFHNSSDHKNPKDDEIKYTSERFQTEEDLKVGAFKLNSDFKSVLSSDKAVAIPEDVTLPEGYVVYNKYITNSVDTANPQVGDVRIYYEKADYTDVSVLGKQVGDTIERYTSKNNRTYAELYKGTKNSTDMINSIESGNKFSKWFKRVLGTLLVIVGIGLILGPITTLIGYIPFLGNIVNSMIGVVSFLVGLIISLLVIAISWFVVRPVLSIILLVVIAGLIAGIIYLKKTKQETVKEK